ncbi:MAG: dihydroorotase family protein, partial [Promethearchaeota archaeon]
VIPSLVEIHGHLRDFDQSYKETYETGAQAAAIGGYTTVFDMPNKVPPVNSSSQMKEVLQKTTKIESVKIIPYLLLVRETEMPLVLEYSYLKAYIGPTTGKYLVDPPYVAEFLNKSTAFISVHCEDNSLINANLDRYDDPVKYHCEIREPKTEIMAIQKLLRLVGEYRTHGHLHIAHVSLNDSIDLLKSQSVSFEVTPYHLVFNTDDYSRLGVWAKVNPPLRSKSDQQKLFKTFLNGKIKIIATDHAPHTKADKEQDHESGMPGLETCLPVLLNSCKPLDNYRLKLIIDALAVNPRRLMRLSENGVIAEGEVANLTVVDLKKRKIVRGEELQTQCQWSPWEGMELQGWPVMTLNKGKITYE